VTDLLEVELSTKMTSSLSSESQLCCPCVVCVLPMSVEIIACSAHCHNFEFNTLVIRSGFFLVFSSQKIWSQMSQMVTNSNVTDTNLFQFLFRLKWLRMNESRQNIPESEVCFCFLFGIRIGAARCLILPTTECSFEKQPTEKRKSLGNTHL